MACAIKIGGECYVTYWQLWSTHEGSHTEVHQLGGDGVQTDDADVLWRDAEAFGNFEVPLWAAGAPWVASAAIGFLVLVPAARGRGASP